MTVLSLTATSRLAERTIRKAGRPVPLDDVVAALGNHGVDAERARAGIRLATIIGRLEGVTDDEQRPCIRVPAQRRAAA